MTNPQPMSDFEREDLSAYLDGELDKQSARALEAKLSVNAEARGEADTLRRTWELLDYLPRLEPSPDFTHRTLERLTIAPAPATRAWAGDGICGWLRRAGWAAVVLA